MRSETAALYLTDHVLDHVLQAILTAQNVWDVVALSEQPFPLVEKTLQQLKAEGYVNFKNGKICLTDKGSNLTQTRGLEPRWTSSCPTCQGKGLSLAPFEKAYQEFETIVKDRPSPDAGFDQGYLTSADTFFRVAFMAQRGDLAHKAVAILGDDDLVSIALGLTGMAKTILVFEIDRRITRFIDRVSKNHHLSIEIWEVDLREKLPHTVVGSCDTFLTDPPEAMPGLRLFLERGLGTLKPGEGQSGYFGMTLTESSLNKWWQLQQTLIQRGDVVITDMIKDFSSYENWDFLVEQIHSSFPGFKQAPQSLWYKSSFYRIETLAAFIPTNPEAPSGELYLDEERLGFS